MSTRETVVVGRIGKPHGIRGEVTLEVRTDEPDLRFAPGQVLGIQDSPRTLTVEGHRWHQGRMIAAFEEIVDRNGAEEARGSLLTVTVDADALPEEEDAYYDRQLIGLRAHGLDGTPIGTVSDVLHLPAQDVLEIDTGTGRHLVPFVAALVPEVDLGAGTLTIAEVEGLFDA